MTAASAEEPCVTRTPGHGWVVGDDSAPRVLLIKYLGENELRVTLVAVGAEMAEVFAREVIDLIVLDSEMTGEDHVQLVRRLCQRAAVPIVLLTGNAEEAGRVMGIEIGADDHSSRPLSPRELLARIRAVLWRYQGHVRPAASADDELRAFRFAGWEFNLRTRKLAAPDERKLDLSNGEFSLLVAFCSAPQQVLTRDRLLELSRLHNAEVYDRTVDVQILRLRRKIETDPFNPKLIVTKRGTGYLFNAAVETLY